MYTLENSSRRKSLSTSRYKSLLSLAASLPVLTEELQQSPVGNAGVCFRPRSDPFFLNLDVNLGALLMSGERMLITRFRTTDDSYGFRWVLLQDGLFEDLVTAIALLASAFARNRFEQQLSAALFPFQQSRQAVYWIYSFRHRTFYPFVPLQEPERDNTLELSLASKLKRNLPIEPQTQRWYPLWGTPLDSAQA